MNTSTDPPNDEQKKKTVARIKWRRILRTLVNRQTLMWVFQGTYIVLKIIRVVREMFGGN